MQRLTITEALAELKTLNKRIEKKWGFIQQYTLRQDRFKDPLEKQGGSFSAIQREKQSISDLSERYVNIRTAIARANDSHSITVENTARTISEWLYWRRDIAPGQQAFLNTLFKHITGNRDKARTQGINVVAGDKETSSPTDIVVNLNEEELQKEIERMEVILGNLDGQLSLKNATIFVDIPE